MMIRTLLGAMAGVLLFGTSPARADVVSDWNAIMLTAVNSQNPLAQSRYAAITQLAVFEAVNAITGDYKPYLGTVKASHDASPEAAAVAAAYRVLVTYFPASQPTFDAARANSLSSIPSGPAKDAGIAAGEAAANAMITLRAADGSAPPEFYVPPSLDAGQWQVTPSCPPAGGLLLQWRNVTPFGLARADQFRAEPPPALTSNRYARSFNETKTVGAIGSTARPQDRSDVALLYAAITAPAVWNNVTSQILASRHAALSEKARAFALVNIALGDAGIAVFDTKYHYVFWRPETAIHNADIDGNPRTDADTSFVPFIITPCFPSYPSAHGTLSNAAREVLERLYGRHHAITISSTALGITLSYQTLREITEDIADARIYGGIHFRFDQEEGAEQGRQVGEYIYRHYLERRHDHDDKQR
ncbi:MAG TPA: vanadium-dependent haloperoxidase [Vicinamibacterales bacterium]